MRLDDVSNNAVPYEPSTSLRAKIARRMTPLRAKRMMRVSLDRPVISFTFDDFPRSAIENGSNLLEAEGWNATFYVATDLVDVDNHHGRNFSADDLPALQSRGHEIAGHTHNHVDCSQLSETDLLSEVQKNADALKRMGVKGPIENFAFPFGEVSAKAKKELGKKFKSLRGISPHTHRVDADLNCLFAVPVFSGPKLDHAIRVIEGQEINPGWLVLFAHDVRENPSEWGCTPEEFKRVIKAVKDSGALVLPVGQAISHLEEVNDSY